MEKINKLSLNDVEWKEFVIGKIFNISGTLTTHPSALINGGQTPRITCAATNNGFENTYQNQPTEKGQVLTVDSATIGFVSYQAVDFIATDHVEKISMKNGNTMNRYIGLFLVNAITYSTANKYGYGYKFSQSRIAKQKILLPVTIEGTPDYAFMEEYMRLNETELLEKYRQYISSKIKDLDNDVDKNVKWKEFVVQDVFKIKNSKAYHKTSLTEVRKNGISYISRTNLNNGLDAVVKNENFKLNKANTIVFGAENATFFYQPNKYITGNKMYYIESVHLNKFTALFLQTSLNKSIENCGFGYGKGLTGNRMKRRTILLPVNETGNPDFEYMENYIKQIEQRKLRDYLEYKGLV